MRFSEQVFPADRQGGGFIDEERGRVQTTANIATLGFGDEKGVLNDEQFRTQKGVTEGRYGQEDKNKATALQRTDRRAQTAVQQERSTFNRRITDPKEIELEDSDNIKEVQYKNHETYQTGNNVTNFGALHMTNYIYISGKRFANKKLVIDDEQQKKKYTLPFNERPKSINEVDPYQSFPHKPSSKRHYSKYSRGARPNDQLKKEEVNSASNNSVKPKRSFWDKNRDFKHMSVKKRNKAQTQAPVPNINVNINKRTVTEVRKKNISIISEFIKDDENPFNPGHPIRVNASISSSNKYGRPVSRQSSVDKSKLLDIKSRSKSQNRNSLYSNHLPFLNKFMHKEESNIKDDFTFDKFSLNTRQDIQVNHQFNQTAPVAFNFPKQAPHNHHIHVNNRDVYINVDNEVNVDHQDNSIHIKINNIGKRERGQRPQISRGDDVVRHKTFQNTMREGMKETQSLQNTIVNEVNRVDQTINTFTDKTVNVNRQVSVNKREDQWRDDALREERLTLNDVSETKYSVNGVKEDRRDYYAQNEMQRTEDIEEEALNPSDPQLENYFDFLENEQEVYRPSMPVHQAHNIHGFNEEERPVRVEHKTVNSGFNFEESQGKYAQLSSKRKDRKDSRSPSKVSSKFHYPSSKKKDNVSKEELVELDNFKKRDFSKEKKKPKKTKKSKPKSVDKHDELKAEEEKPFMTFKEKSFDTDIKKNVKAKSKSKSPQAKKVKNKSKSPEKKKEKSTVKSPKTKKEKITKPKKKLGKSKERADVPSIVKLDKTEKLNIKPNKKKGQPKKIAKPKQTKPIKLIKSKSMKYLTHERISNSKRVFPDTYKIKDIDLINSNQQKNIAYTQILNIVYKHLQKEKILDKLDCFLLDETNQEIIVLFDQNKISHSKSHSLDKKTKYDILIRKFKYSPYESVKEQDRSQSVNNSERKGIALKNTSTYSVIIGKSVNNKILKRNIYIGESENKLSSEHLFCLDNRLDFYDRLDSKKIKNAVNKDKEKGWYLIEIKLGDRVSGLRTNDNIENKFLMGLPFDSVKQRINKTRKTPKHTNNKPNTKINSAEMNKKKILPVIVDMEESRLKTYNSNKKKNRATPTMLRPNKDSKPKTAPVMLKPPKDKVIKPRKQSPVKRHRSPSKEDRSKSKDSRSRSKDYYEDKMGLYMDVMTRVEARGMFPYSPNTPVLHEESIYEPIREMTCNNVDKPIQPKRVGFTNNKDTQTSGYSCVIKNEIGIDHGVDMHNRETQTSKVLKCCKITKGKTRPSKYDKATEISGLQTARRAKKEQKMTICSVCGQPFHGKCIQNRS